MFTINMLYLLLAAGLSLLIGLERELRGKDAGIRTHLLVGVGSCLIMILSRSITGADPARLAAGAITGLGFLGAGVIMKGKKHANGLTTAAGLWSCSAIGLACGMSRIDLAIVTAIIIIVTNTVLSSIFRLLKLTK